MEGFFAGDVNMKVVSLKVGKAQENMEWKTVVLGNGIGNFIRHHKFLFSLINININITYKCFVK